MASTTKKGSKSKKPRLRRPVMKTSATDQVQTIAELRQQLAESLEGKKAALKDLQDRDQQLAEAMEHQTATSEVLSIISRSPTDVQPVLDAIVESAGRVCGIDDVLLRLHEGDSMVPRAHFGPIPIVHGDISTTSQNLAGCESMAPSTSRTSAREVNFPRSVPPVTSSPSWPPPFARRGNWLDY